ncbi:hypothetical protein ACSSS7_000476 [Eimeria intestinalis]
MQQLRRFGFFDRSIVERPRYVHSPCEVPAVTSRSRVPTTTSPPCEAAKDPKAVCAPAVPSGLSPLPASTIVCTAGTDTSLWLGDNLGVLHTLDHDSQLKSLKSFDISFVAMHAAAAAGCIVCIGRDNAAEKPGGKAPGPDVAGPLEDLKSRQGMLKYKCYSTTQVDSKGHPVLLREAGLFSKLPEQVVTCSDINKNFTMLAV